MALPIYRYPLDRTGINRDNLILNEPHTLAPKARVTDVRVAAPLYGPMYSESLIVVDAITKRKLEKGIDYKLTDLLQTATLQFAKPVTQFVVIINGTVSNEIEITYQCVGGNYQNDSTAVIHAYETFLNDARAVDWEDITGKPNEFPPSPHIHLLEDVIGWGPMLWALERVREAILLSNSSIFENFLEWFKYRPVDWNLVVNRPTTLAGYGIVDAVHVSRRIRTINGIIGGGTLAEDLTLQLSTTGVVAGTYGERSKFPVFTVDDRGRITQASTFDLSFLSLIDKPTTLAGYGITDAVNLWGAQTITGQKTFTREIIQQWTVAYTDAYRIADQEYGAFWRMENKRLWLLLTNSGNPLGNNNDFRPFWIDMSTGEVHFSTKVFAHEGIEGNASTASKLRVPVKMSISGGATAVPRNFDGSADFDFVVSALDVSKVTAGVLSGAFGGTGLNVFTVGQYFVAETLNKMKQITPADMMTDIGKTRKIIAGVGLLGGGDLGADVTVSLAPPGTLTGTTPNASTAGGHTHALAAATTTVAGVVRLATDQEVKDFTGTGVVTATQLKNAAAPGTVMPVVDGGTPWNYTGKVGVSTKYAREDHVHPSNKTLRGNHNGGVFIPERGYYNITTLESGIFCICSEGATIQLPHPSNYTEADAGLCVRAYVHGYNTSARVNIPLGYGGSGSESYTFFSTIAVILVKRADGQMGWFTTDDGHTIFTDSQDAYYQNLCYTRLGNPAWGHIAGPYGMVGGTINGVSEGEYTFQYPHAQNRWLKYQAVRAFVNISSQSGSSYVGNVLSMSTSALRFEVRKVYGPGAWGGLNASIIVFGC